MDKFEIVKFSKFENVLYPSVPCVKFACHISVTVAFPFLSKLISISIFFIREGLLFGKHSEIITTLDDANEDMLEYIIKFYEKY